MRFFWNSQPSEHLLNRRPAYISRGLLSSLAEPPGSALIPSTFGASPEPRQITELRRLPDRPTCLGEGCARLGGQNQGLRPTEGLRSSREKLTRVRLYAKIRPAPEFL